MNRRTLIGLVSGAVLAGGSGAALAASIAAIEPASSSVVLEGGKAVVRFTVSGSAVSNDNCGYFVEYGDGMAGDSRIIDRENGSFARSHERIFTNPGTYTVRASGKRVKTTNGCDGAATATVTVVAAPGRQGRRADAPACPEGWMLNENSVNWRTGAFSCSPKPVAQMACGDGLRYYERDGMIGCRLDRQDRRDREERNR